MVYLFQATLRVCQSPRELMFLFFQVADLFSQADRSAL
ncbi:hypothetical protein F383_30834 [Gossypium arboreum]|uniref:Uncharacterized protein n=1 Tax=Gossypium arboreum TaxID=29729 RepID=A0A0B0MYT7_GOSAR|nr:hypothetical protein F383_30834 [Gossypium arboreum]